MEGCFMFQWGGVYFSDWGWEGFIFKWGRVPHGEASILVGSFQKKIGRWGGASLGLPPLPLLLYETLRMKLNNQGYSKILYVHWL